MGPLGILLRNVQTAGKIWRIIVNRYMGNGQIGGVEKEAEGQVCMIQKQNIVCLCQL